MRRFSLLLCLIAVGVSAEVWNDASGISVTATSQTLTFPRPFTSVLVSNDDSTNEAYIRLFWCSESTTYLSSTNGAATTSSLEIKAGKTRSFTYNPMSEPDRYCAISLVCAAAETATVRVEGK